MADVTLVDEHDRLIGREEYLVARRLGHWHRLALGIVVNRRGEILLQKRSQQVHEAPGRWDVAVGGHVDPGMSYRQTVEQEAYEELGLSGAAFTELGKYTSESRAGGEWVRRFCMIYLTRYDGELRPEPDEVSDVRWVAAAELTDWIERSPEDFALELRNVHQRFLTVLEAKA